MQTITTWMHPVSLPVKDPVMGYRDLPRGGLVDSYFLADQPGYALPFQVHGYFDLTKDGDPQKLNQRFLVPHPMTRPQCP